MKVAPPLRAPLPARLARVLLRVTAQDRHVALELAAQRVGVLAQFGEAQTVEPLR